VKGFDMRTLSALFVLVGLLMTPVDADCPPCGPDMCLNDARYPKLLAAKKAALAKSHPADLVALMDRDGACVMRVNQAPDGFTILSVKGAERLTIAWDTDQEEVARKQLLNGTTTAYYKFNVRQAFACCNQPKPQQRPDWDADLELSRSLAIKCVKAGNAVKCGSA
jgi:hypothetical protein